MTKFIKLILEQIRGNQIVLLTSGLLLNWVQLFLLRLLSLNRKAVVSLFPLSAILQSVCIICDAGGLFGHFERGLLFIFFRLQKFDLLSDSLWGITAWLFVLLLNNFRLKVKLQFFLGCWLFQQFIFQRSCCPIFIAWPDLRLFTTDQI